MLNCCCRSRKRSHWFDVALICAAIGEGFITYLILRDCYWFLFPFAFITSSNPLLPLLVFSLIYWFFLACLSCLFRLYIDFVLTSLSLVCLLSISCLSLVCRLSVVCLSLVFRFYLASRISLVVSSLFSSRFFSLSSRYCLTNVSLCCRIALEIL